MHKEIKFDILEAAAKAGAEGYVLARNRGVEDIVAADGLRAALENSRLAAAKVYLLPEAKPILEIYEARTEQLADQLMVDQQR